MCMGQEIMDYLMIKDAMLEDYMADLARNKCWETADKRVMKISEMNDAHLMNTIRWLEKNKQYYCADSFIRVMRKELKARK